MLNCTRCGQMKCSWYKLGEHRICKDCYESFSNPEKLICYHIDESSKYCEYVDYVSLQDFKTYCNNCKGCNPLDLDHFKKYDY